MAVERILYRTSDYDLYATPAATRLCMLVHGLDGSKEEDYWGKTATLLKYERQLRTTDICLWEFASDKSPWANLFSLARRGRRLAVVPEVSTALATTISSLISKHKYNEVYIAGHSLGGYVAMLAANHQIEKRIDCRITRLLFMSMPIRLSRAVKLLTRLFPWNPHIRWLGAEEMRGACGATLPNLRLNSIHTTYLRSTLDEIAHETEGLEFDGYVACQNSHSWPSQVYDRKNAAYQILLSWMAAT